MNQSIRVPQVRLIDEDKQMLGVFTRDDALAKAEEAGLDLVMISPEADPPVCRIVDYSKFKYEQGIKLKEAQKKMASARQDQKELKMRYNIDTHDYEVRLRAAQKFLKDGCKVKVLCQFRGREMEFKQIAFTLFEKFAADVKEEGVVEGRPNIEGRSMIMMLGPMKAETPGGGKPGGGGLKPLTPKPPKPVAAAAPAAPAAEAAAPAAEAAAPAAVA